MKKCECKKVTVTSDDLKDAVRVGDTYQIKHKCGGVLTMKVTADSPAPDYKAGVFRSSDFEVK